MPLGTEASEPVPEDPPVEGGSEGEAEAEPWILAEDDREMADERVVRHVLEEAKTLKEAEGSPVVMQNLTFMEPSESRHQGDVLAALQVLRARIRALGVPVLRLHTDRAKEFLSRPVRQWCREMQMVQTLSSGDDPKSNGRVEAELHQLKRRLRLTLTAKEVPHELWPCAMRHVTEERLRHQLRALAVKLPRMLPFYEKVLVKVKRWHQAGAIQSPYKEALLLGPSPLMSHGWVVCDNDHLVQHARAALLPDPLGDAARIELSLEPDPTRPLRRRREKGPLHDGPRLAAERGEYAAPFDLLPEDVDHPALSVLQCAPGGSSSFFFFLSFFVNHVAEAV